MGGGQAIILLLIVLSWSFKGIAQLPCHEGLISTECSGSSDPAIWASFKCIAGTTTFSQLIMDQLLLPQAAASTTPQMLAVKGIIKDDISTASGGYKFAPGTIIIFADQTSGIEVEPDCKLELDNTILRSCGIMWKSIFVKPEATFIAKNGSYFYSADDAVVVSQNAKISITDCTFQNNFRAIKLGMPLINGQRAPIFFTQNGGIWGNTILGAFLNPPKTGLYSFQGISIQNVSSIQIGKSEQNQNSIQRQKITIINSDEPSAGIFISNSDVTVTNTYFKDIGFSANTFLTPTPRDREAAISCHNKAKTTIVGYGINTTQFEGCHVGVYVNNAENDISGSKFLNNKIDIVHETNSGLKSAFDLRINNCKFEGFQDIGVWIKSNTYIPLGTLEVNNSIFDDNRNSANSRRGLVLEAGMPTDGTNFRFYHNEFHFRYLPNPSTRSLICVNLTNIHNGLGEGNTFYDAGTVPPNRTFKGLNMDGCIRFRWEGNDFISMTPSLTFISQNQVGATITNSPFCKYNCNSFTGLQYGMIFCNNSDASILRHNNFNSNSVFGLHLEYFTNQPAVIGRQFRQSNVWTGTGAEFGYLGFSPFNALHRANVQRSLFSIEDANETTTLWPTPRIVGAFDDAMHHVWFRANVPQNPEPYPVYPCTVSPFPEYPELDFLDTAIINGTFQPWNGFEGDAWETSFYLYKRLSESPSLMPAGSLAAYWFGNNQNENLGKLFRVFDGFSKLSTGTTGPTAGSQLLAELNTVSTDKVCEQNLKTWLQISLDQYIYETATLSTQQVASLTTIADQCRPEGGIGVVMARLTLGQPSQRELDCNEEQERGSISNRSIIAADLPSETKIFPNPASKAFTIQLNHPAQDAELRLTDSKGQLIGKWKFTGTEFTVQPEKALFGMYFLEISANGQVVSRNKIVFTH